MITILVNIAILSVLILLSGAFSAIEIALSSANRTKLKMLAESGDKKAVRLLATLENPTGFFAVTQLYITFIALFLGAYAAGAFTDPIINWALNLGLSVSPAIAEPVAFVFVTIALTYFSLVFGELVPKHIALRNSTKVALSTIGFFTVLSKIVLPFVNLLSVSANLLLRIIGFKDDSHEDEVTKDDVRMLLKSGSEHGNIAESEHNILTNVLKLDDKTVEDICVHRIDVVGISLSANFDEILNLFVNEQYSRVPVYDGDIDHIVGVLHMKDVMKFIVENPKRLAFDIKDFLRELYFTSALKKANELLVEMQKKRLYMAAVIDEYGGTIGIVTIEDLVEEIVGSILDEHDADEPSDILPAADNLFVIQGTTDCEKVKNYFGTDFPADEYETLSGFLIGQLNRIPDEGERPEIRYKNLLFKVDSVKEKRIAKVVVSIVDGENEVLENT